MVTIFVTLELWTDSSPCICLLVVMMERTTDCTNKHTLVHIPGVISRTATSMGWDAFLA